ncbi:MAG: hypothetical protein ACI4SG_02285 [Oligosphaeraceae bacterium]
MHLYTTSNPIPRHKRDKGRMEPVVFILLFVSTVVFGAFVVLGHLRTEQTVRSLRKEIRETELRREELQKTLLNRDNKLEELMDGGSIARLATPLGLRHPPHNQKVIPMKVCRTQEGRIIPVTVGARR